MRFLYSKIVGRKFFGGNFWPGRQRRYPIKRSIMLRIGIEFNFRQALLGQHAVVIIAKSGIKFLIVRA